MAIATACLAWASVIAPARADTSPTEMPPTWPQRAYVWQRAWTPAVCRAVREHAAAFAGLDVLAAELAFGDKAPEPVFPAVNWDVLRAARRPFSLVIRIGPCRSPWTVDAPETKAVVIACDHVLGEAHRHGLAPDELQLDFDAASSRLADYGRLIEAIRREVAPPSLVITVLPTWLDQPEFSTLIRATDGYVLQVHSLDKPTSCEATFTLCDTSRAEAWIARAAALGCPFRIALPSYAYRVAFRPSGEFLGLQAEGAPRRWPAGTLLRTVVAEERTLARFVHGLRTKPPPGCSGLSWFRLPTDRDELAWRWCTLEQVMAGIEPSPQLTIRCAGDTSGAIDVVMSNEGTAATRPSRVTLSWHAAQLVASDARVGWRIVRRTSDTLEFEPAPGATEPLPPGGRLHLGWLRLDRPTPISASPL